MQFNYATKRMTNFEHQRNMLLGLISVLLIVLVILSACLFFRSERVIVLPPEVKQEFWVEGNRFSPEYLEEMAVYFLHLALDVNQMTLTYNTEILTRYSDVEAANYLHEKYERDIQKLKKNNASTTFEVKEVTVFPDLNIVRAEGILKHYVGSKCIKEHSDTYEVVFKTYRGRLFFKEIKQVEGNNETNND